MIHQYLLFSLFGFVLGSLLFSFWLPKLICHVDIVALSDDHNPGTANAVKHAGVFMGMICLLCDLLKGALPVYLALRYLDARHILFVLVMAAPVLGHAFSPWGRTHGGKAIAVSFGVLLGLLPFSGALWGLVGLFLLFSLVIVINPHNWRVMTAFILFGIGCLLRCDVRSVAFGCVLVAAIVCVKHYAGCTGVRPTVSLFGHKKAAPFAHQDEQQEAGFDKT